MLHRAFECICIKNKMYLIFYGHIFYALLQKLYYYAIALYKMDNKSAKKKYAECDHIQQVIAPHCNR